MNQKLQKWKIMHAQHDDVLNFFHYFHSLTSQYILQSQDGYSGLVTGMIEWGQKSKPKNFQKALHDITQKISF